MFGLRVVKEDFPEEAAPGQWEKIGAATKMAGKGNMECQRP